MKNTGLVTQQMGGFQESANDSMTPRYHVILVTYFYVAHNAMLSYLKTWRKQSRYRLFGELGERENRLVLEMVK